LKLPATSPLHDGKGQAMCQCGKGQDYEEYAG